MRKLYILVAMLYCGVATSFVSGREDIVAQTDGYVSSREWSFRPVTMQNPALGSTRDLEQYNLYFNLAGDVATVHLPVEWVSMSIFTEEFTVAIENYSATFVADDYWRILFTFEYNSEQWAVEVAAEPTTGKVELAMVTRQGTMRYIGSFWELF